MQTAQEFDKEHDGGFGSVVLDGWYVYADGARMSSTNLGFGPEFREPHSDKERLLHQLAFWQTRLKDLMDEFTRIRYQCTEKLKMDITPSPATTEKLRQLQTNIRSARARLSRLTAEERGYSQADVARCWDVWESFAEATRLESAARQKFESALLGKSAAGVLEKLKHKFDQAKRQTQRAMEKWNDFRPEQARHLVSQQLEERARQEAYNEVSAIEV